MWNAHGKRLSHGARALQLLSLALACVVALVIGARKVRASRADPPVHAQSVLAHPAPSGAAHAKVGIVLVDVSGYDIHTGTFEADLFLSLTSDRAMGPVSLAFTNGTRVRSVLLADTPTFKLYRCRVDLVSPIDLRSFPFDSQALTVELEDRRAGVDQLVLEPDESRTALDEGFEIAGWRVGRLGAKAWRHAYPPRFDHDDLYVSRYEFRLTIDRHGTSAAFGVYVPAFIIVLISLFGLWVPPDHLTVRTNAGAPMLAAAVLFHYSLLQSLPETGYLTRADKVMLAVYVSIFLTIATTLVVLVVDEAKVDRVLRAGRTWVPAAILAIMIAGSVG